MAQDRRGIANRVGKAIAKNNIATCLRRSSALSFSDVAAGRSLGRVWNPQDLFQILIEPFDRTAQSVATVSGSIEIVTFAGVNNKLGFYSQDL
jgi:hypothetical protein